MILIRLCRALPAALTTLYPLLPCLTLGWITLGCHSTVPRPNASVPLPSSTGSFLLSAESTPQPSPPEVNGLGPNFQRADVASHDDPSTLRSFHIEPALRIDSGGTSAAAEVSMAASGDTVVAAWIDLRSGADRARVGVAVSEDFGVTWSDRLLQPTGDPNSDDLHGDPMTAYDPVNGHLWAGGLAFFDRSLFVARHLPGTSNFTSPSTFGTSIVNDKPWLAAGPIPGTPESTRLYAIEVSGVLYVSNDLGSTWTMAGSMENGIGHLPRVGPGGVLYVAYRGGPDVACQLQRSDDGGQTFGQAATIGQFQPFNLDELVAGEFRVPAFCILAVDPNDGSLYLATSTPIGTHGDNTDLGIVLSRSNDQGQSWSPPQVISGRQPGSDQFLPWIEVDTSGRLHLVYLDTRRIAQGDQDTAAFLDVYYSTSDDGGQRWTEVPLTEQAFDSTPSTWLNGISQFVGDYLALTVSQGRVMVGYAATHGGDLDIYAQRIVFSQSTLFRDGFESGDTSGWNGNSAGDFRSNR